MPRGHYGPAAETVGGDGAGRRPGRVPDHARLRHAVRTGGLGTASRTAHHGGPHHHRTANRPSPAHRALGPGPKPGPGAAAVAGGRRRRRRHHSDGGRQPRRPAGLLCAPSALHPAIGGLRALRWRADALVRRRQGVHGRQRVPARPRPGAGRPALYARADGAVRRDRQSGGGRTAARSSIWPRSNAAK